MKRTQRRTVVTRPWWWCRAAVQCNVVRHGKHMPLLLLLLLLVGQLVASCFLQQQMLLACRRHLRCDTPAPSTCTLQPRQAANDQDTDGSHVIAHMYKAGSKKTCDPATGPRLQERQHQTTRMQVLP